MENELFVGRLAEAGIVNKEHVDELVSQLEEEMVKVYAFFFMKNIVHYRATVTNEGGTYLFQGKYSRNDYEAYLKTKK